MDNVTIVLIALGLLSLGMVLWPRGESSLDRKLRKRIEDDHAGK